MWSIKINAEPWTLNFEAKMGGILVTVYRNDELSEGLNEGLSLLLNAIINNPGIQAKDLSALLEKRPIKTIDRQIAELTKRKLIERKGSKKTGGYYAL